MTTVYFCDSSYGVSDISVDTVTRIARLTAAGSNYDDSAATVASGTQIQFTSGGSAVCYATAPLEAVTISGSVSVTMYARESNMSANIGGHLKVYRRSTGGALTLIGSASDGVEFGTAYGNMTWTITPTSTAIASGERLVFRWYIENVGTMNSGHTGYMTPGSSSVAFTETLTVQSIVTGSASLSGAGTMSAVAGGSYALLGSASLSGAGSVTATANVQDGYLEGRGFLYSGLVNTYTGLNVVDAFNFRTDTKTNVYAATNDGKVRTKSAGVASISKGYVAGGYLVSAYTADVEAIDLATASRSDPSVALSTVRGERPGSVSSATKGYFAGGHTGSSYVTSMEALTFSSETMANLSATLLLAKGGMSGIQSGFRGYFCGYNYGTEIEGIRFDTESSIDPTAGLSLARGDSCGICSQYVGYVLGGYTGSTPYHSDIIDRLEFGVETSSTLSFKMLVPRYHAGGVSGLFKGLACSGQQYSGTSQTNVEGVDFLSEAQINYGSVMGSYARTGGTGVSAKTLSAAVRAPCYGSGKIALYPAVYDPGGAGFMYGPQSAAVGQRFLEKLKFSAETFSSLSYSLSSAITTTTQFSETFAYYISGTVREAMHFMSEAFSTTSGSFSTMDRGVRSAYAAYSAYTSTTGKFNFSTLAQSSIGSSLPGGRGATTTTGVQSDTAGYYGGGNLYSTIDKFAFSSETYSTPSVTLSAARYNPAGLSAPSAGIMVGGQTAYDTFRTDVDGVTFASETAYSPGSSLSSGRASAGSACSYTNGYVLGGMDVSLAYQLSAVKVAFASGSVSNLGASMSGPSAGRYGIASASYYRGGVYAAPNMVGGYGTATATATVLTGVQVTLAGVGSAAASGTLIGGASPVVEMVGVGSASCSPSVTFVAQAALSGSSSLAATPYVRSLWGYAYISDSTSRFAYYTETVSAVAGYSGLAGAAAVSARSAGYSAGGGEYSSAITKVLFSTDVFSGIIATLAVARNNAGSVKSSTHGYFCGGKYAFNQYNKEIDGLAFASESAYNPASTLGVNAHRAAGVWSSSYGYLFYAGEGVAANARHSLTDRIVFATDTVSALSEKIEVRSVVSGVSTGDAGYLFGYGADISTPTARTQKFNLGTETLSEVATGQSRFGGATATVDAAYVFNADGCTVFSFLTEHAYLSGASLSIDPVYAIAPIGTCGFPASDSVAVSVHGLGILPELYACVNSTSGKGIQRNQEVFSFSSETLSGLRSTVHALSGADGTGVQNNDYGYFLGGGGAFSADVFCVVFQTEADRVVASTLPDGQWRAAGHSSPLAGYSSGGYYFNGTSNVRFDQTQKLLFSSEATSALSDALAVARSWAAGVDSDTRGYVAGGNTDAAPLSVNTIESVAYSTDAVSTLGATLSAARMTAGGVMSDTRGYFCGGLSPTTPTATYYSEIDGIQFSNNSAINPSATLDQLSDENYLSMSSATKGYVAVPYDYLGQRGYNSFTFSTETASSAAVAFAEYISFASGYATSYIPGTAQTHFAAASLGGAGQVAASATEVFRAFPTFAGSGSLAAVGTVAAIVTGSASAGGAGGMSAAASLSYTWTGVASFSGTGALEAVIGVAKTASADLSGTGQMSAVGQRIMAASATVAGVGTAAAAASVTMRAAAAATGIGGCTATVQRLVNVAAAMNGAGTVTAIGHAFYPARDYSKTSAIHVQDKHDVLAVSVAEEVVWTSCQ